MLWCGLVERWGLPEWNLITFYPFLKYWVTGYFTPVVPVVLDSTYVYLRVYLRYLGLELSSGSSSVFGPDVVVSDAGVVEADVGVVEAVARRELVAVVGIAAGLSSLPASFEA